MQREPLAVVRGGELLTVAANGTHRQELTPPPQSDFAWNLAVPLPEGVGPPPLPSHGVDPVTVTADVVDGPVAQVEEVTRCQPGARLLVDGGAALHGVLFGVWPQEDVLAGFDQEARFGIAVKAATAVEVQAGDANGGDVEVLSGLQAGQKVLGKGAVLLKPFVVRALQVTGDETPATEAKR